LGQVGLTGDVDMVFIHQFQTILLGSHMSSFSYAVIGTGGIGGFYGGRLAKSGCEVHFLLHSDYEYVKKHGLLIKSKDGDFLLSSVNAYQAASDIPRCDVVLICLKAVNNAILKDILPPIMKKDSVAVVMENGLGVEAEVAKIAGPDRVMGGLCFICSHKIAPGVINHIDYGSIKFGEYSADHHAAGITHRMRSIARDFSNAGIGPLELSEDLYRARWQKLVWNIPFNGLCITLNTDTQRIMRTESTRTLARSIMDELIDGAAVLGHGFPHDFADKMMADTDKMIPYQPSMKLDFDAGKPTELEYIFGNPLRALQEEGFKAPLLESLYREIRYLTEAKATSARPGNAQ
jgi:2-dehydropantoate 2-reductase